MYIYIFDDGMICTSPESPTETDLISVEDGTLSVLCVQDNTVTDIGFDGVHCPLPKAILSVVDDEVCHVPEDDYIQEEEEG